MKTDFIPVNESLKTGMLLINHEGEKTTVKQVYDRIFKP